MTKETILRGGFFLAQGCVIGLTNGAKESEYSSISYSVRSIYLADVRYDIDYVCMVSNVFPRFSLRLFTQICVTFEELKNICSVFISSMNRFIYVEEHEVKFSR